MTTIPTQDNKTEDDTSAPPAVSDSEYDDEDEQDSSFCGAGDNSNNVNNDKDEIPDEFICPLTLEIFKDPLMDRRGMNFERSAIVEWLNRGHNTCPLTREPLGYRSLIPNANLQARVEHWKREHNYHEVKENHMNNPDDDDVHRANDDDDDDGIDHPRFFGMLEAPPNSALQLHWAQLIEESEIDHPHRRRRRLRRRRHNIPNMDTNNSNIHDSPRASPLSQRRRLAVLFGDALNIVRRPPLSDS